MQTVRSRRADGARCSPTPRARPTESCALRRGRASGTATPPSAQIRPKPPMRSDLFERRRHLMDDLTGYLAGRRGRVIPLRRCLHSVPAFDARSARPAPVGSRLAT